MKESNEQNIMNDNEMPLNPVQKSREDAVELTPEEKERFEKILAEGTGSTFSFQNMGTWENFKWLWDDTVFDYKEELLEARKNWFQMKKGGKAFENFLTEKIRILLDNKRSYPAYRSLLAYAGLDYKNSVEFLSEVLDHKQVWTDDDGSTAHQILNFFRSSQDPKAKDAIIRYIEHALSEDYNRKNFLSGDLAEAACALKSVLGESARGVFEDLAAKDKTFAGWFEKKKLGFLSDKFLVEPKKKEFDEFDAGLEAEHLEELEAEYEELKKNSPPPKKKLSSSLEPWGGGWDEGLRQEDDEILGQEKEGLFDSHGLYRSACKWRQEATFLNFYGRFRPKAEDGVFIGQENYLNSLFAASSGGVFPVSREIYLNFLSGVVQKKDAAKDLPEKLSVEEAYKAAALSLSRSLCLGILENRIDEAVSEISAIKDFLGLKAETTADSKEIAFMVSLSHQLSLNQGMLLELKKEKDAAQDLPKSANAFLLYHSSLKKAREIPDFRELLREKIRWFVANTLFHNMEATSVREVKGGAGPMLAPVRGASFSDIKDIVGLYIAAIDQYKRIEDEDVPVYWEAGEKLEDFDGNRVVVFGRDGKYFFTALKTVGFGKKEKKELKYVVITSPMADYSMRKEVASYLKQNGVTLDFTFIDTGFRGSVPEFAIRYLAESEGIRLSGEEIDKKIKLLSSSHEKRGELSRKKWGGYSQDAVGRIEDRPKTIRRPEMLVMDENGRVWPETVPNAVSTQLLAWTVEHAVLRNFAPRLDAEKRIRYFKQNPLEGYTFIQEYRGSHIGTHPMQLWEDQSGKKVLVKGGPSHTLKADFVGQRFLRHFGLLTPKTELISTEEGKKLKMGFLEDYKTGGITLPPEYHKDAAIQSALLVDALVGNYDRTPWNLMFAGKGHGGNVMFIDNGASLTSRSRGGHKGFPDRFTIQELKEILSNPQFPGRPVNEAYQNFIEVKYGKIIVKNMPLLAKLLQQFKDTVNAYTIDMIIEQAEFQDGERSKKILEERISKLTAELAVLPKNSEDYRKTAGAVETYKAAITAGGEATYLKKALRQRRDDIINLFSQLEK